MTAASELFGGGGSPLYWVSGTTYSAGTTVRSPLDQQLYTRINSGAGATDPADDLANYIANSYVRVTAISGVIGPAQAGGTPSAFFAQGAVKPALPVAATGVRTLALSLSGRGSVGFVGLFRSNAGSTQVEIIVDGRTVLNTTNTFAASDCAIYLGSGGYQGYQGAAMSLATAQVDPVGLPFRRTFQVFVTPVTSSLTASDFLAYKLRSEA